MAGYSRELIDSLKHRYEETNEPMPKIAADHEMSLRTLERMAKEQNWRRRMDRPPRGLPPAVELRNQAEALAVVVADARDVADEPGEAKFAAVPDLQPATPNQAEADFASCGATPGRHDTLAAIERIARLVEKELAAEEAVRASLGDAPRAAAEARRAARTLGSLTQTMSALHRLRSVIAPAPQEGVENDDIPADIDEFRRELARRIDAFVDSRTGGGHAAGDCGPAMVDRARP